MLSKHWQEIVFRMNHFLSSRKIGYNQKTYYYTPLTMYPRSLTPVVKPGREIRIGDIPTYHAMVYVHIPFCTARCTFCPFQLEVTGSVPENYIEALIHQVEMLAKQTQMPSRFNIYFGGGSPNLLSLNQVDNIVNSIRKNLGGDADEISMELHPEVINKTGYLEALSGIGISRVSFGLQSTNPGVLRATARRHGHDVLDNIISLVKKLRLNVNIDVMYGGLPEETLEMAERSFEYILGLEPDWITGYQVCIQDGTLEMERFNKKRSHYPNTEDMLYARAMLCEMSKAHGYKYLGGDYFSRNHSPTLYHTQKWSEKVAVLSLGSGCYSYIVNGVDKGYLWWAPFTPEDYLEFIDQGQFPVRRFIDCTQEDVESWTIVARLKTSKAVVSVPEHLSERINALTKLHLLVEKTGGLLLTPDGFLVEDLIYASLMPKKLWRQFSRVLQEPTYTEAEAKYDWFFNPNVVLKFQSLLASL